ncbi:glycosyltransferase [Candidatus Clostridium radicumherbarum]|uniref:Glycosyltransferase n=1 Tax=Candidatus Clostridium radicumherbarum TaxID=3381662 RepID=A0ABW8TUG6_9CLOT
MNVLYLTSMYPVSSNYNGGIFITQRVKALNKLGIKVIPVAIIQKDTTIYHLFKKYIFKSNNIYDFINYGEEEYVQDDIKYNVVYYKVGIITKIVNYILGDSYITKKIAKSVSKSNYYFDIIHAHWLHRTGSVARIIGLKSQKPYFVTCHGSDVNYILNNKKIRYQAIRTLHEATEVEFVSKKLLHTAQKYGYKGNNYEIIPNGIWIDKFIRVHKKNTNNTIKKIGFVGNLIDVKRADKLGKIISNIVNGYEKEIEIIIVGSGKYEEQLKVELKHYNVKFYGSVNYSIIPDIMSQLDLLILPSRNEGWPCVVLEAHICGVPVIGSDRGGIPEAINNNDFIVNEDINFEERFSSRVIQYLNNQIFVDKNQLINRAKEFDWTLLQKKSCENYNRGVKCY